MRDHLLMKVFQALEQLVHNVLGFSLADSAARPYGMTDICE